jgi:hypothetical protein
MFLLASKQGRFTGNLLAKKLNLYFTLDVSKIIHNRGSIAVRFGNAQSFPGAVDTECNSVESIIKMSNKQGLWRYLQESDVFAPKYYPFNRGQALLPDEIIFPCLSRHGTHRAGRDITVCNSPRDIPWGTEYLVNLVNTNREYRVHVLQGEVIKVFRKEPLTDTSHRFIRSTYHGWRYALADLEQIMCANSLVETAKKVSNTLGSFFCGIDMAWSPKDERKEWVVWEVNSAPSLNTPSLELYTTKIRNYITGRFGEDVFCKPRTNYERSPSSFRISDRRRLSQHSSTRPRRLW